LRRGLYFWKPPASPVGLTGAAFTLESTAGGEFTQDNFKARQRCCSLATRSARTCADDARPTDGRREQLKLTPQQVQIVFASVDPARDTLKQLTGYLSGFGTSIVGLTGTQAQVDAAKARFPASTRRRGRTTALALISSTTRRRFFCLARTASSKDHCLWRGSEGRGRQDQAPCRGMSERIRLDLAIEARGLLPAVPGRVTQYSAAP